MSSPRCCPRGRAARSRSWSGCRAGRTVQPSYVVDLDAGRLLQQVAQRHRSVGRVPEVRGQVAANGRVDVEVTLVLRDARDQSRDGLRLAIVVRRYPLEQRVKDTLTRQAAVAEHLDAQRVLRLGVVQRRLELHRVETDRCRVGLLVLPAPGHRAGEPLGAGARRARCGGPSRLRGHGERAREQGEDQACPD